MNEILFEIFKKYIHDFEIKNNNCILKDFIVKDSIPIIYFGNFEKFLSSKNKVVTVGLNPSNKEFTEQRFQIIDFKCDDLSTSVSKLYNTLNEYFNFNPYNKWFLNGEFALNSIGASYYDEPRYAKEFNYKEYDTAIHLDIYTPIATNPHM